MKRIISLLTISTLAMGNLNADKPAEPVFPGKKPRTLEQVIPNFRFNALSKFSSFVGSKDGLAPFICVKKNDPQSFHSFITNDLAALKARAKTAFDILDGDFNEILKSITPEDVSDLGSAQSGILPATEAEFDMLEKESELSDEALVAIVVEIIKLLDDKEETVKTAFLKKLKRVEYRIEKSIFDEELADNPLSFLIHHQVKIRADLFFKFLNLVSAKLLGITPEQFMTQLLCQGSLAEKGKLLDDLKTKVDGFSKAVQATPVILSKMVEGIEEGDKAARKSKFAEA